MTWQFLKVEQKKQWIGEIIKILGLTDLLDNRLRYRWQLRMLTKRKDGINRDRIGSLKMGLPVKVDDAFHRVLLPFKITQTIE